MKKYLFVEPSFPIPPKSRNHSDFLPIGLLKLASYHRKKGHRVKLNRGNQLAGFYPDKIFITSLFTYWSSYVKDAVTFYRRKYPRAIIEVGGIYATLMPDHCKEFTGCDKVFIGQHNGADKCLPAYDLVNVKFQIIHGMRGCSRKCPFCGIWKIENKSYKTADEIRNEICSNKIIFYDNNILDNPNIEEILTMLSHVTYKGRPVTCECQSGFDGRKIEEEPHLANMIKKARFRNIRVAWDFTYEQYSKVENWIKLLVNAGYKRRDIFVFMIYNWSFDYFELEQKRSKCFEWGVQIADCRFRPLNQTFDNYNSRLTEQSRSEYYIHSNWSDQQIRKFRKDVRKHNICLRYKILWKVYEQKFERLNSKKHLILTDLKE